MKIRKLHLVNFRNYRDNTFDFSPGINLVLGRNAQGKTNLLEALFLLSRGYSHRAAKFGELAAYDKEDFFVSATVERDQVVNELATKLEAGKKTILLNRKQETKRDAITKVLTTILFEPDDLKIVKEGPEKRRRFMNQEISGYKPHYGRVLANYNRALSQRNALLKNIRYQSSLAVMLDSWDEQLVSYGVRLIKYRLDYLVRLNEKARVLHRDLSGVDEALVLYYKSNVLERLSEAAQVEEIFRRLLAQNRSEDIAKGSTAFGPQVDDILIHINGKDAKKYASQGQQRTAAIALKLSQIDIYKETTGDYPVVLLDDILSELDQRRQQNILSILGKTQALITGTDAQSITRHYGSEIKVIRIEAGQQITHSDDLTLTPAIIEN